MQSDAGSLECLGTQVRCLFCHCGPDELLGAIGPINIQTCGYHCEARDARWATTAAVPMSRYGLAVDLTTTDSMLM